MNYENKTWTVRKLQRLSVNKMLNLCPPYQRNDIWSTGTQKQLIKTMLAGWPLPTFFLLRRGASLEMVDGQQRTRAILEYLRDCKTKGRSAEKIMAYRLNITLIDGLDPTLEHIEKYYALVNSAGVHLNRPELSKAKYYDTRFLSLVQRVARDSGLFELKLFSDSGVDRMVDVDFVAELLVGLLCGITDKKIAVDTVFEKDVDELTERKLEREFCEVLRIFQKLNAKYPLKSTRYRQRNDFYSLFMLFRGLVGKPPSVPQYFYRVLRVLGPQISPSQDRCETLKSYAIACVTQSNGKAAREVRDAIMRNLLMNRRAEPTENQMDVLALYGMGKTDTIRVGEFLTLNADKLETTEPVS